MWRPDSLAGGCGAPAAGGEQRSPGAHGFDRHSANAQTAVGDAASAGIRRHWHGDAAVDCPGKNWPGTIGSPLTNTSVVDTSAVAQGADRSRARRRRRVEMAMAAGGSCHCDCTSRRLAHPAGPRLARSARPRRRGPPPSPPPRQTYMTSKSIYPGIAIPHCVEWPHRHAHRGLSRDLPMPLPAGRGGYF